MFRFYRDMLPYKVWFLAVLVINSESILATLVIYREWLFYSYLELGDFFLDEATFSSLSIRTAPKSLQKLDMFRATVSVATVINRVPNFWPGHK